MKNGFAVALLAVSFAFVGCDSDSSDSGECKDSEVKSDCTDGKYSLCVDGAWTQATCKDNASCRPDGTCGECVDGNYTQCENDSEQVGKALVCKQGSWSTAPVTCPGLFSCAMTDDCYKCYEQCNKDWACKANDCEKNEICKAECREKHGTCESRCGTCLNMDQKNCTNDANDVGSADICLNGTWYPNTPCSDLRILTVSCTSYCKKASPCHDGEFESICGECKNTKENEYICVNPDDPLYGGRELRGDHIQKSKCEGGMLRLLDYCVQVCDPKTGVCE